MELPKNIKQIGETNPYCKIYVEDYAVSFLKQLNKNAMDKDMAAALYGYTVQEGDISYIFIYGVGKLDLLQREVRHLSQAQLQEMERIRRKYFQDYETVGYRLLNGEMMEGMHIYEQGICRYIAGYAEFYEKNDSMLAYMLDYKGGSPAPEVVDWEKYDNVLKRREERKIKGEYTSKENTANLKDNSNTDGISENERKELNEVWNNISRKNKNVLGRMKFTAAVIFALLCIVGVANINDGIKLNNLKNSVQGAVEEISQQKLNDASKVSGTSVKVTDDTNENKTAEVNRLVAQDKLADAVLNENNIEQSVKDTDTPDSDNHENTDSTVITSAEPSQIENINPVSEPQQQSYVIKKGDTLLGISLRQYGNTDKITEICSLNNIDNPDDIKVGQKILLP
jgi:hypothetical protein